MMRRVTMLATLVAIAAIMIGCDSEGGSGGGGGSLSTLNDSAAYAIGLNFGKGIKEGTEKDSIDLDIDLVVAGIRDGLAGKESRLSDTVAQQVIMAFQQLVMSKQQERMTREGTENQKKGDEFLAKNKSKAGVKTTPSGLQYIVKKEGTGESPDSNQVVTVEYRGTLVDGTEFDKSQPGQPAKFPVNGVIPGWTEALLMMKPGGEYQLFVPASLAYGQNAPPTIGPNQTLIFDVKLLKVEEQQEGTPNGMPQINMGN